MFFSQRPKYIVLAILLAFIGSFIAEAAKAKEPVFLNGIDANYWLYLATEKYNSADWSSIARKNEEQSWYDGSREVDLLKFLHENGVNAFRIRLWVSEDGPHGLEYAIETALAVQKNGMKPHLVIFLSDSWADFTKQPRPGIWKGLDAEVLRQTVRAYCAEVTKHFQDNGIEIDIYAIGNEIDLGICGAFPPSFTQVSDADRIKAWTESAEIIKSAIAGVKSADPDGKIMLHIAMTWVYDFALAFFGFMLDQGIDFDYMGLSYYPSNPAMEANNTIESIDSFVNGLYDHFKHPIIISEYAFPHTADLSHALFKDWNRPVYGYEPTKAGQQLMLSSFLDWARKNPHVYGAYYWSPEWYTPSDSSSEAGWGPMCLFDSDGKALPAVKSFLEKISGSNCNE